MVTKLFITFHLSNQIVKINAAARGVIWDVNGDWVLGYNKYLGSCSVFLCRTLGNLGET